MERRLLGQTGEMLRGHGLLLGNAFRLMVGSTLNAVLGFAFWWLAARLFIPAEVGGQSALIAVMGFVALLGEAGFGTLLLGEVQALGADASPLIAAASLAGTAGALILALPTALLLAACGWASSTSLSMLLIIGCALQGLALTLDQAFVGLLRSDLFVARNAIFALVKLALLGVAAFSHNHGAVLGAWIAGVGISEAVICVYAWRYGIVTLIRPSFRRLFSRFGVVIDHHFLNLTATAPTLLLPVVVNACLGPAVNAAFYAGWTVYTVGLLVPASLTSVLFSMGGVEPTAMPARTRLSMALSATFAAFATVLLALFPNQLLAVFNPAYPALAGSAVSLFGLGLFGAVAKQHLVLVARYEQRMVWGARQLAFCAVTELALAGVGGLLDGVAWLTIGWLIALAAHSIIMLRPVLSFCGLLPNSIRLLHRPST